jgi:hypothetical protein
MFSFTGMTPQQVSSSSGCRNTAAAMSYACHRCAQAAAYRSMLWSCRSTGPRAPALCLSLSPRYTTRAGMMTKPLGVLCCYVSCRLTT